jgi:predicted  nucleic acid-binding Zn-ribbon protein
MSAAIEDNLDQFIETIGTFQSRLNDDTAPMRKINGKLTKEVTKLQSKLRKLTDQLDKVKKTDDSKRRDLELMKSQAKLEKENLRREKQDWRRGKGTMQLKIQAIETEKKTADLNHRNEKKTADLHHRSTIESLKETLNGKALEIQTLKDRNRDIQGNVREYKVRAGKFDSLTARKETLAASVNSCAEKADIR